MYITYNVHYAYLKNTLLKRNIMHVKKLILTATPYYNISNSKKKKKSNNDRTFIIVMTRSSKFLITRLCDNNCTYTVLILLFILLKLSF